MSTKILFLTQVLDMIESRRVEEFDFFMVASDISRVQLADKGNVNVLHHPWCYPNTKFKGKDSGNWHVSFFACLFTTTTTQHRHQSMAI
jgi:hypothetical protein